MRDWALPGKAYSEMVMDYIQLAGYKKDAIPVITRKDHPHNWREWYAYYKFRNLKFWQELMRTKPHRTVPCLSPLNFDPEFTYAGQLPAVPIDDVGPDTPKTPEAMARVAKAYAMFRGIGVPRGLPRQEPEAE